MGVSMLPRFAAMVIMTMVKQVWCASPSEPRASSAKGTNVTRATSFVMSMLEKKASSVSARARRRGPRTTLRSLRQAMRKTPRRERPVMMVMRLKSMPMVRRST